MIMYNLHRYHIRERHSKMCALKHGSIKLIAQCVHASLHIFTMYYALPYMEVKAKNNHRCPFPNGTKQQLSCVLRVHS